MRKLILLFYLVLWAVQCLAQEKTIRGTVVSTDGSPLVGASVSALSHEVGTITDDNGNFSLSLSSPDSLKVTFIGFSDKTVYSTLANEELKIILDRNFGTLDQIVVTGYQTQKKVDLTGAISSINLENIVDQPKSNIMQSLQGHVTGLHIESSGDPTGRTSSLLIRGNNTLGNADPLYLIDGVPTKDPTVFSYLNPNAIESVQILKDASATSIYGSRASNGVIIVTTKKGKGKLSVGANSSITLQDFSRRMKVTNTEEYGRALWQAAVNDGTDPAEMAARYTYDWHTDGDVPVLDAVHSVKYVGGDTSLKATNTDWQNALFRQGLITNNSITISGATDNSSLFTSLGYLSNKSVIKENRFKRINAQVNSSTSFLNGKIKFGENFHITSTSEVPLEGDHNDLGIDHFNSTTIINNAYYMQTRLPVFNSRGEFAGPTGTGFSDRNNPVHMAFLHKDNRVNNLGLFGNLYLEVKPITNLLLRTSVGVERNDVSKLSIEPTYTEGFLSNDIAFMETLKGKTSNWTWTNTATYSMDISDHKLDFLLGVEAIHNDYEETRVHKEGFAINDPNYFQLSAGTGSTTSNGLNTGNQLLSYFAKINYNFSDKYLASATIRRDGSSRFGLNHQFAYFPSFSVGWRINNENFLSDAEQLSDLKLRIGYGLVGNQEIGDLARFGLYQTNYGTLSENRITGTAYDLNGNGSGNLPSGFVLTQLENNDLRWESTRDINIGIDFGFFEQKLSGSFDYFKSRTKDILTVPPFPAIMGEGSSQSVNGATMSNQGVELLLNYKDQIGPVLFNIQGTLSRARDKITFLPSSVVRAYPGNIEKTIIGHSLTSVFGYLTDGIFQNDREVDNGINQPGKGIGRLRWVDLNHDSKIDALDQTWLGNTLPDFDYGINVNATYANFTFSIFGSGVTGRTVSDESIPHTDFASGQGMNFGKRVLNAWTTDNPSSSIPMLSLVDVNDETRSSNYLLRNGSYFKLREASIRYAFPQRISSKIAANNLSLYLAAENFLLIKAHGKNGFAGQDPETPGNVFPRPIGYTLGININF